MEIKMININHVMLSGRLVADPKVTVFENGGQSLEFTIANSIYYKKDDGDFKEITAFVKIRYTGKLVDRYKEKLHKASPVYIEGNMAQAQWEDADGKQKSMVYIKARKITSLEKTGEYKATDNQKYRGSNDYAEPDNTVRKHKPVANNDIDIDDIPF